ncbi:MAG: RNA polymerase sigma factor [Saprospiraceae bacterium]|nr:RNA polymerase sigma factor [Saprospiraceae bacterium]
MYDRYAGAIYAMVLRIVRKQEFAEEIVQDTFLKVWKNIDQFDESRGKFFTWIYNIARNEAIDKKRSKEKKVFEKTKSMDANLYSVESSNYSEIKVEDIGVKKLLEHLDEESRTILDLVYFHGYTHQETADETGTPLGTVKTKIRRGLIKLREVLVK